MPPLLQQITLYKHRRVIELVVPFLPLWEPWPSSFAAATTKLGAPPAVWKKRPFEEKANPGISPGVWKEKTKLDRFRKEASANQPTETHQSRPKQAQSTRFGNLRYVWRASGEFSIRAASRARSVAEVERSARKLTRA